MTENDIMARLESLFEQINQRIEDNLNSQVPYIAQVCRHILLGKGKRLRPTLFVLGARLCGYKGDLDIEYSIIFEYIHAASLLHDDVIDDSDVRRGKRAAHIVYGNQGVVLVGDFLTSTAFLKVLKLGQPRFIERLLEAANQMSEGEILQLLHQFDAEITEAEYSRLIYQKTGALIEGACRLGAVFAEAPDEYENNLAEFGTRLGKAFQMIDDTLDYSLTAAEFGKPVGHDLDEGKITLPVILALAQANEADHRELRDLVVTEKRSPKELERVKELISRYDGFEQTRKRAEDLITEAKGYLASFPDVQEKRDLENLADYITRRRR
ncbi:MAG: polyprenyl synthetase family protein [Deltaproteobacteria bacterium]|nr:polyprenyl synthetase family protein [Deltaproteobacteria bacterium]